MFFCIFQFTPENCIEAAVKFVRNLAAVDNLDVVGEQIFRYMQFYKQLLVHRSSETSTNQSDVIIRSDDRFLYLVVDSDSQCLKYICYTLFSGCFFFVLILTFCSFIPAVFFLILTNILQFCPSVLLTLSQYTYLNQSIMYLLLPGIVHFISGVTHMETNVLFCSKLMFTNWKIVVCKYTIRFYSNLYFCETHIWTSLLFMYCPKQSILYQVLHIWKPMFCSKLMFTN